MLKYFTELGFWEKVNFLISKPLFGVAFMYIAYQVWVVDGELWVHAIFFITCLVFLLIMYALELKIASTTYSYKTRRGQDVEKVLEISARYLQLDFSQIQKYRKSMRGELSRRGFTQKFHIRASGNRILVSLSGDFPFPISLINWISNHSKIESELRSHAYFRT